MSVSAIRVRSSSHSPLGNSVRQSLCWCVRIFMLTKKSIFFPRNYELPLASLQALGGKPMVLGREGATGKAMRRGEGSSAFWGQNTLLWLNLCQAKPGAGVKDVVMPGAAGSAPRGAPSTRSLPSQPNHCQTGGFGCPQSGLLGFPTRDLTPLLYGEVSFVRR